MHRYLNATIEYKGNKKEEIIDIFGGLFGKNVEENELLKLKCTDNYSVFEEDLLFDFLKKKCMIVPQGEELFLYGYLHDENSSPATQRIEATVASKTFKMKTSYWYDTIDMSDYSDAEEFCDNNGLDYDESWEEFYEENQNKDLYDYGDGDYSDELYWNSEKIFK